MSSFVAARHPLKFGLGLLRAHLHLCKLLRQVFWASKSSVSSRQSTHQNSSSNAVRGAAVRASCASVHAAASSSCRGRAKVPRPSSWLRSACDVAPVQVGNLNGGGLLDSASLFDQRRQLKSCLLHPA
eukprot:TRINITY_DN8693_c0_g1_i2.p1 TRINITY_DN8693_c0_g1~~TRINITY_DN8693_c0_g1_i2.p1  ORF type:complete len:128 (-),score=9.89 TRINITY_DN8693_c0_g1_i2:207-590(-)